MNEHSTYQNVLVRIQMVTLCGLSSRVAFKDEVDGLEWLLAELVAVEAGPVLAV